MKWFLKNLMIAIIGIFLFICCPATMVYADTVYVEGEGYLEPTENSQVPFDPSLTQQNLVTKGEGDYSLTVNPMVDNYPDNKLYITLLNSSGEVVTGAAQGDFTLAEQSETETQPTIETITCFEEATSGTNGISFSLVFDVSGSMGTTKLADAKQSAINFLNSGGTNDRASLVKFSTAASVVLNTNWINTDSDSNGTYDIIDQLSTFTSDGGTALYDGTAKGIDTLTQEPEPKAVIIFTDGDTNSDVYYNINTVIQYAQNQGISVYTIGLGSDVVPSVLQNIASSTGGAYYFAPTAQDMADIYDEIAKDIRNQYQLCYTTHNPAFDGTLRTVTVTYQDDTGTAIYRVNSKPIITLDSQTLQLHEKSQVAGAAITISGTVKDVDAQALGQNLSVSITFSTSNASPSSYTTANLTLGSPDSNGIYTFSYIIPAGYVNEPGIIYYIYASDGIQDTYSPVEYNTLPYTIAILDNHAPDIVHTPVTNSPENQVIPISATISDPDVADTISSVILYYRVHNPDQTTPFHPVSMTDDGGGNYSAQIPADAVTFAGVDYFISAWDSNTIRAESGTSVNPHFVSVGNENSSFCMSLVQEIPTNGALDIESFSIDADRYIVSFR